MSQFWEKALQVQIALSGQFRPATESITKEIGLEPAVWNQLIAALSYEPEPISVSQIGNRNPYTDSGLLGSQLETLKTRGFLEGNPNGDYHLTDEGRAKALAILETQRAYHATILPLPESEIMPLASALKDVVVAVEKAPTPPGNWNFTRARHLQPGASAETITQIDHYVGCLNAFRDDAHLSAWKALGIGGPEWEALTLIWRGEAKNADELSQKLPFRGQTPQVYQASLDELERKGWVEEDTYKGTRVWYEATASGKALREEAEATTDKNFDSGCSLSEAESVRIQGLLEKLSAALA